VFTFILGQAAHIDKSQSAFSLTAHLHHTIPKGMGISGIAVLGNQLFVTRGKVTSKIDVYNSDSFSLTRSFAAPDLKSIRTIAACSHHNCLYVSDSGQKMIHRYAVTGGVFTKWPSCGDCYGLSVTREFNLLATLYSDRRIQEYTTHGTLIRTICLEKSITRPWHCSEMSSGHFVLCCDDTKQSRACIVDTNGNIVHSYGGAPGSGVGCINGPRHMAVDKDDHVMIADLNNNRVVVLSSSLSHIGEIAVPGHTLNRPRALCFDESNGLLYIGELTGGRLFVLKSDVKGK